MEKLLLVAEIAGAITGIIALVVLLCKPLREWLFGLRDIRDGQRCLLRNEMTKIYYRHREERKIRQFEYENFDFLYKAYKRLKGNSFVDHIRKEIEEWEVIS